MTEQAHSTNPSDRQVVLFEMDTDVWALDLAWVTEVIPSRDIAPLPNANAAIAGMVNLRGAVIPVVQLSLILCDASLTSENAPSRILLIRDGDVLLGLLVNAVSPVHMAWAEEPSEADEPSPGEDFISDHVRMTGTGLVPVLNVSKLVHHITQLNAQPGSQAEPYL